MKDIGQIEILKNSLNLKRDDYIQKLIHITGKINDRKNMLDKIKAYQTDYQNHTNLEISKKIPFLLKNIDQFIDKLSIIIQESQNELALLDKEKEKIMDDVNQLNQKIDLMDYFKNKVVSKQKDQQKKIEQNAADDLAMTMPNRWENE